jgi:PAS domain S-box-containing protein
MDEQREGQRDLSEQLAFFEGHPDMVVCIDADGDVSYANPAVLNALGLRPSDVVGHSIVEFLHPDDLDEVLEAVAGLTGDRELGVPVTPSIFRIRMADGTYLPVEINGTVVERGPLAGWMTLIGRHPVEHLVEAEITEMLARDADLTDIIALLPRFGLWRHPAQQYAVRYLGDGEEIWTGSAAAVELGRTHHDPGTPWGLASTTRATCRCEFADLPEELQAHARALGQERCIAKPVEDPLGGEAAVVVAWSSTGGPGLEVHHGCTDHMARILSLILRWRFHQTQLVAQNKLAALGRITAGMAHEIRNPLNFVLNFTEVAGEVATDAVAAVDDQNPLEARELIERLTQILGLVQHHAERIQALMQIFIGQTQGEAGPLEEVDLSQLARDAADLGYHGYRAAGHGDFRCDIGVTGEQVRALVRPQALSQVILNLVANACAAMDDLRRRHEDDRYRPALVLHTERRPDAALLSVSDNGPGVPPAIRDRIFDPFFTTKGPDEGTGMGLALCRDVVGNLHGGELLLESTDGVYRTFKVVLPQEDESIGPRTATPGPR